MAPSRNRVLVVASLLLSVCSVGPRPVGPSPPPAASRDGGSEPAAADGAAPAEGPPLADGPADAAAAPVAALARDLDRIPPGSYVAALLTRRGSRFATWVVDEAGGVSASPFVSWQRHLEEAMGEGAPAVRPVVAGGLGPCGADAPAPAAAAAPEEALYLVTARPRCGRLALPGGREGSWTFRFYGREPAEVSVVALWPERPRGGEGPVLLAGQHEGSLSAAGPLEAIAVGDLDGDGLDDVAFVGQGIEDCDRPPCDLFWVTVLMSSTPSVPGGSLTLLRSGDLPFSSDLAASAPGRPSPMRWRGAIRGGRYEVSVRAPSVRRSWVLRLESGLLRLEELSRRPAAGAPPPTS